MGMRLVYPKDTLGSIHDPWPKANESERERVRAVVAHMKVKSGDKGWSAPVPSVLAALLDCHIWQVREALWLGIHAGLVHRTSDTRDGERVFRV